MEKEIEVFDFHRIFVGDLPPLFLLEVAFRTLIMYSYTMVLLRILGKRGMGQLSTLEVAIIISFGSAVGDPMINANAPIVYGLVAVTVVTIFQIWLERVINRNKKVEALLEGEPRLMVDNGVIQWECMIHENLSKEDLFRFLRDKEVEHLGQIRKALFEISGNVSVMFQPPRKVKPGLSVLPDSNIAPRAFLQTGAYVDQEGWYSCTNCGHSEIFKPADALSACTLCQNETWIRSVE